jgi:hypothetical protein
MRGALLIGDDWQRTSSLTLTRSVAYETARDVDQFGECS